MKKIHDLDHLDTSKFFKSNKKRLKIKFFENLMLTERYNDKIRERERIDSLKIPHWKNSMPMFESSILQNLARSKITAN